MKKFLLMTALPVLITASIIGTGFATWSFSAVAEQTDNGTASVEIGTFEDYSAGTLTKTGGSKLVLDQLKSTENSTVPDSSKDSNRTGVHWDLATDQSEALTFNYSFDGLVDSDVVEYTITLTISESLAKYVQFTYKNQVSSASTLTLSSSLIVQKSDVTNEDGLTYEMFKMTDVSVAYINDTYPTDRESFEAMKTAIGDNSTITASIVVKGIELDTDVENGGFETGNLTGWTTLNTNVSSIPAVSNADTFWDAAVPYNKTGTYFLDGWNSNESALWEIKSSYFTLSGSGYLTFKMGGRSAILNVYNAVTGEKIAKYTNTAYADPENSNNLVSNGFHTATMSTFVANLSSHLGARLYITLQDDGTSNWGMGIFDAITAYNENAVTATGNYDTVTQNETETQIAWVEATNEITE